MFLAFLIIMLAACKSDVTELSPTPSASEPHASESEKPTPEDPTDTPTPTPEESPVSPGSETSLAEINDNVFDKEYSLEGSGEEIVGELYISVPEIEIEEYQYNADMINEYFELLKENYREEFEYELSLLTEEELSGHGARRYLDLSFSTEYNRDGIISFMIFVETYQGGAHGNMTILSETFNLRDGTRVTADNLFTVGEEEYTSRIKQYILEVMDKNVESGQAMYFDNYHELVEATYDKEAFVLTEDSLLVYFQVYDLAPYAAGVIQFHIPYEYLEDILIQSYGFVR